MGEQTNISWCDKTFNSWIGCTKVSNGERGACVNCYAEDWADKRFGRAEWGGPGQGAGTRVRTSEATWRAPLTWDRKAAKDGTRPFVFCSSLADVFDNQVDPQWRRDLFDLIRRTPHLIWLLLTKRPQNIQEMCEAAGGLPRNAAIGCTIVTQEEANRDLWHLGRAGLRLNALFTFVSIEPMMGPIDLTRIDLDGDSETDALGPPPWEQLWSDWQEASDGETQEETLASFLDWHGIAELPRGLTMAPLGWVICGGESGPKARPSHPDWFRSLRDQCASAGVPFHFKQHGEWMGYGAGRPTDEQGNLGLPCEPRADFDFPDGTRVFRIGKKAAGRLLDGVLHDARPEVPALAQQVAA